MIEVTLSRDEMIFAAIGAVVRNIDALLRGRTTYYGDPYRDLWANNVTGALGECAVNKHYGRYWTPCYDEPSGVADMGKRAQVRTTTVPEGPLRIYSRDKPDHAFVLVVARPPRFTLMGWMWGHEARRDEWKVGEAHHVPQAALRPVAEQQAAAA